MKTILKRIGAAALVLLVSSACRDDETFRTPVAEGPQPKASFTHTVDFLRVAFTNASQDAESFYWEFGDGTTSTEKSPGHTYAAAGYYTVKLTVRSEAGYSASAQSDPIYVVGEATADFIYTIGGKHSNEVSFDASLSQNLKKAVWDFGDGMTGEGIKPVHTYDAGGDYKVRLTVTGLLGDTQSSEKTVHVDYKSWTGLAGGGMEAGDAQYWQLVENTGFGGYVAPAYTFGWTADKPSGGKGGCLRFEGFYGGNGMAIQLTHPIDVVSGKKYRLSCRVKAPADALKFVIRLCIKDDLYFITDDGDNFMALNTWGGWGTQEPEDTTWSDGSKLSVAVDGDMLEVCKQNGSNGPGVASDGVYTAAKTSTVYVSICLVTHWGTTNGDVLIDEVRLDEVE